MLALREWKATETSTVKVEANFQLVPWSCGQGDGVQLMIFYDGKLKYFLDVAGNDCESHTAVLRIQIVAGERLSFLVDPKMTDHYDGILFEAFMTKIWRCFIVVGWNGGQMLKHAA